MKPVQWLTVLVAASLLLSPAQGAAIVQSASREAQSQTLRIVVIAGEDAVNVIQRKTAVAPIVEVRDQNGLPVAGVPVTFTVVGKSASFGSGLQAFTATTNAAGRVAAVGLNPLSSGPLQINVTAVIQGQTATATIAQTNFLTAAQAAQAGAAGPAGNAGAAGAGGGGGGLSPLAITGIVGAAAAGAVVATQVGQNGVPTVAGATATPSAVILGTDTAVRFSVQASDPDNDALTYQWDFGDGGTSTEASPAHVYQTAGAFTARVTVRDGKDSATAQTTVNVKTLTGTWQSNVVPSIAFGDGDFTFRITQSGTNLEVTLLPFANSISSRGECQFTGSVKSTAPRVFISGVGLPCPTVLNGVQTAFSGNTFELEPGPNGDTLSGTLFPTPRAITFTRR